MPGTHMLRVTCAEKLFGSKRVTLYWSTQPSASAAADLELA